MTASKQSIGGVGDEFAGKVVLVTGGASGIGYACATWFAERGSQVHILDHDPVPETSAEFERLGVRVWRGDVRIEKDVQDWIDQVSPDGRIDVLVYSAGVGGTGRITDFSEADYDRCLDTNLKGAFLCAKHAVRRMSTTGGGVIVHIASNSGVLPRVHDPVYCVSKAGLIMLTKALALAHSRDKIRVNAVCPGPVDGTRMIERDAVESGDPDAYRRSLIAASPMSAALGRMGTTDEVAAAVGYLASDAAAMVTGTILQIDGGKALGVPPRPL